VEEERGLFERVGAAGDDDAGDVLVGRVELVDAPRQADPLLQRELAAGHVGELFERDPRVTIDARHRLRQFLGGQPAAVLVGNGAAGGDEMHPGQRRRRPRR
jgi:hypothetical protein